MKDERVYLDHILECLTWIDRFTAAGQQEFSGDRKTQSAVLRELQTLAESSQRLSGPLKDAHPEIPWREMAGFRNMLVHNYLGVNLERVWEIVRRDLPVLRAGIEAIRRELSG